MQKIFILFFAHVHKANKIHNFKYMSVYVLSVFMYNCVNSQLPGAPRLTQIIFNPKMDKSTGILPDELKVVETTRLFKKTKQTNDAPHYFDNYRPISLLPILPTISKVFEKVIFIHEYINENQLSYQSQYGFHSVHYTESASLEITDIITKELDRGKYLQDFF